MKYIVPNGGKIILGKGISVPNSNLFYTVDSTHYPYYLIPAFHRTV